MATSAAITTRDASGIGANGAGAVDDVSPSLDTLTLMMRSVPRGPRAGTVITFA